MIPDGGFGTGAHLRSAREAASHGVTAGLFAARTVPELDGMAQVFKIGPAWHRMVRRLVLLRQAVAAFRPDIVHVFWHPGCELYPFTTRGPGKPAWLVDARSPNIQMGARRLLFQASARLAPLTYDVIAAHAQAVGRALFKRADVTVVPPGYDDTIFFPRTDTAPAAGVLHLVYIGTLDTRRGLLPALEALVRAARTVAAEASRKPVVAIYGSGDGEADIRALAAAAPDLVEFGGYVPQAELAARLRTADVGLALVPGRRFHEAPPLKTIEFLGGGLPVIASDTAGNRQFVHDGVNGWLVDDTDEAALTRLLATLCRDGVPPAMRQRCVESVQAYTWRAITRERLLPLYESCLARRTGA